MYVNTLACVITLIKRVMRTSVKSMLNTQSQIFDSDYNVFMILIENLKNWQHFISCQRILLLMESLYR